MLPSLTDVASAPLEEVGIFRMTGYTCYAGCFRIVKIRPDMHVECYLTAAGEVSGEIAGVFTFQEWLAIDLNPIRKGFGKCKNYGIITITNDQGQAVIEFQGKAESGIVIGDFKVVPDDCTGAYAGLRGSGQYTGNAGLAFTLIFTGELHLDDWPRN